MSRVTVTGVREARAAMRALDADVQKSVKNVVKSTLAAIHQDAQSRVPVDEGDLRKSLKRKISSKGFYGRVFTDLKPADGQSETYAAAVEFGRKTGKGGARPPQPFLFPAAEAHKPRFEAEIRAGLGTSIAKASR